MRKRQARRVLTLVATASLLATTLVVSASATTEVGGHEIEADMEVNTDAFGDVDWIPNDGVAPGGTTVGSETGIFGNGGSSCPTGNTGRPAAFESTTYQATLICDTVDLPGAADANVFVGGAKEDDTSSQLTKSSPVTPKTDLIDAFARGVIDTNNDAWIIAAYEVIPKQGSYHTNVEFNQFVRCVTSGDIVQQADECAAGEQVVPYRTPGDALLAVDIGGSNDPNKKIRLMVFIADDFDNNAATEATYKFGNNATTTFNNADFKAFGANSIDLPVAKVFLNTQTIDCPAWGCYDEGYNVVGTLPPESFVEVAFNISSESDNVCLNNVAFKSRASGQSVTSQLKDTTDEQPFPFCGGLAVQKYIDRDEDGLSTNTDGDPDDPTADPMSQSQVQAVLPADPSTVFGDEDDLSGWSFTVLLGTDEICTGTTDVNGKLASCKDANDDEVDLTSLSPGTYTVRENTPLPTDWQNTDPGGSSPYEQTVTISLGGTETVYFGNTCLISYTVEVTSVPAGVTPRVYYKITPEGGSEGAEKQVDLTESSTTGVFDATLTDLFEIGDAITWTYGTTDDADSTGAKTGNSHTFVAADGYPSCAAEDTVEFADAKLVGFKYKDTDGDGVVDAADKAAPLGGWDFKITGPGLGTTGTTVKSTSLGKIELGGLAPGTYRVTELGTIDGTTATNWERTKPATNDYIDVTLGLGETMDGSETKAPIFLNAPLSEITVGFQDLTGSTDVVIDCDDADDGDIDMNGDASGTDIDTTGQTDEDVTGSNATIKLSQSVVTCTFTITDP